jgi:transposase
MSRRQKDPLRALTVKEEVQLQQLSRSQAAPATQVARAKAVLAVAAGLTYTAAARQAGRVSGDAVSHLVARFNREGIAAVVPQHGGGPQVQYTTHERELILAQARRPPDRETDGTATWSLSTLQRALRQQQLPGVSRSTIWCVLRESGLSWQHSRTWCDTGTVQRERCSDGVKAVWSRCMMRCMMRMPKREKVDRSGSPGR